MRLARRTVLKAIAGVLMAPTVTLRKTVDREAILRAFCDTEAWRYDLTKPIVHGDYVWATDAKQLIRALDYGFERDGGERKLPPLNSTWDSMFLPDQWADFRLPRIEELTHTLDHGYCPLCDDRRVSYGPEYPTDQETCDNLPDWDVDTNTIRDVSCPMCHGRSYHGPNALLICGIPFSYESARRIALLPNPRVSVIDDSRWNEHAICIAGDGFEGLSMGITHSYVTKV